MAAKVLDSYALMAFFEDEPGADLVRGLILKAEDGSVKLLMSAVNLGEVWYSIARATSSETADQYVHEIEGMAIEIVNADWPLTRQAALFKASGKIAYVDCFAAALAKTHRAELITGDKEFKALEGEIKVVWMEKEEKD
jgi:predicted nucleic acid-binding protein